MIIKARSRTGGKALGHYLLNEGHWAKKAKPNERVEIWEAVDVVAVVEGVKPNVSLAEKLQSFEVGASGTRCQKPLYHVQLRTDGGEHLTRRQWMVCVDRLEERLGMVGHDRVVVAHTLGGQVHVHAVWNRIDYETGRVAELSHDGRKRVALARELEKEFGLRELREHGKGRLNEKEQAMAVRQGKKPEEIKAIIQTCYGNAANGVALQDNLGAQGLVLARGERRDFLVVDGEGIYYGLGRVTGEKAKAVRERLSDLDREALPSVEAAKVIALERRRVMEEQNPEERKRQEIAQAEAAKVEAIGKQEQQKREAIGKEEERKKQAIAEQATAEEQSRSEAYRKEEAEKQVRAQELTEQQFQQQLNGQLEQLQVMQQRRALEDAYLAQRAREAEEGKRARQLEGDVTNPHGRYGQALGQHYDVRDSYGSLSRAAMAEHGAFMRERQSLDRQIAQEKNPDARKALELRKQIEGAEYMAITDRRIAAQSEVITGKRNSPEAEKSRERATAFEQEAKQLREQYREHQLARERGGVSPQAGVEKGQDGKQGKGTATQAERVSGWQGAVMGERTAVVVAEPPLMVMDRRSGKPPVSLAEFVRALPERAPARDAEAQRRERQRGEQALNEVGAAMKAGKPLNAEDVKNLPRQDLEQIKQKGDRHLRERVQQREQAKEQVRSSPKTQGKEQER